MQCNTSVKEHALPFVLLQPSVNRELSWRKKGFVLCWFDFRVEDCKEAGTLYSFPSWNATTPQFFWKLFDMLKTVSYQQPNESCLDRAIITVNWFHMMGCQSLGDTWLLFQELNYFIFRCSNQEASENIISPWKQEDQRGDFNKELGGATYVYQHDVWMMALHSRIAT